MSNTQGSSQATTIPIKPASAFTPSHQDFIAALANAALKLLVSCVLFFSVTRTFIEPDIYRHLQLGMDMCRTGALATKDCYSFLSLNQPWINHEWLSDLIFGYVYWHFGWVALVLLKSVMVALMLVTVLRAMANWNLDTFGKSFILLMVAFFSSLATNLIRPHIFSCLFLAITFSLLGRAKSGKPQGLWWLPPLFALWVNLHGGFALGLFTLWFWTVLESLPLQSSPQNTRGTLLFYWLIFTLSCVATLINPYGYKLPLFVLSAMTIHRPYISEWLPMELISALGPLWAGMVITAVIGLVASKKRKDIRTIILWLVFALAPLVSIRHLEFFGIATALLLGEHLASAWNQRTYVRAVNSDRQRTRPDLIFSVVSLTLSIWLVGGSIVHLTTQEAIPGLVEPSGAVAILRRINAKGNILIDNVHWGSYISWNLAPSVKVSWDGRDECVYPQAVRLANLIFEMGSTHWDLLFQKFPIDMVLVRPCYPTFSLMMLKPGWELAYQDDSCALFLPIGSPQSIRVHRLLSSTPEFENAEVLGSITPKAQRALGFPADCSWGFCELYKSIEAERDSFCEQKSTQGFTKAPF